MARPHAQDGRWAWIVCLSATLSWLVALAFVFSFGIFFPVFMDHFKETREKTAWVGSLAIAIIFFSGHVSGTLVKRFGCRVTTLLGGFLCTLSLGLSSLVKNIDMLYLTYSVFYGLGASCLFSASLNIISKYFRKRRSMATGIVTCGQGGGVVILAPLLQTMIDTLGWRKTFQITAGVVPVLCLSGLTYSPNVQNKDFDNPVLERDVKTSSAESIGREQEQYDDGATKRETSGEQEKKECHVYITVWKEPKFVVTVISAIVFFGHYVPQIHLVRYCEDIGISADAASRLFVYYGLASCAGRLLSGRLCDFKKVNTFYVYQASELVVGTLILVVTMASSYVHMIAFSVIYGFCDGVFVTTLNVLLMTCVSPQKVAAAISWQMQISSFFSASGPPVAGLMADTLGSYTHAFYMSGAVVIAGACTPFLLLFIKTEDPGGAKAREEVSKSLVLNDAMHEISITMNSDDEGEKTGANSGSQEETVVCWKLSVV